MPYQNQNVQFGRSSSRFYRYKRDVYFCTRVRKLNKIITFFPSQQNGKYSVIHKARNGTQQESALFAVQGIAVWYQSTLSWGEIKETYGVNPQTKTKIFFQYIFFLYMKYSDLLFQRSFSVLKMSLG